MKRIPIPFFEAYVTNVCNFNCVECNRLNNYKFSGHFLWSDVEADYKRWSEKIEPKYINILGGEPFLNRDLPNWIQGLRSLWPFTTINLLTNGTQLNLIDNLYSLLESNKITLIISLHNRSRYQSVVQEIKNLLSPPIKETFIADLNKWLHSYNQVKDESWPDCQDYTDFDNLPDVIKEECISIHNIDPECWQQQAGGAILTDANNITVRIDYAEHFTTGPLKYQGDHQFKVYNSDPEKAHKVCISKYCTEMVDGKLYKCHHVALLPKFMKQYQVNISSDDKNLLLDYKPLSSDATVEEIEIFVNNLRQSIPQCTLCPENLNEIEFFASTNKPKIKKIFKVIQETK